MEHNTGCAYAGMAHDWVKGSLPRERQARFEQHLRACPACQEEEKHARVVLLWEKCRQNPRDMESADVSADA